MVVVFDIETTGLDPYENEVIVIGIKKKGEIRQWKIWEISDEAEMILLAVEEVKETDETIIGYNNLKFDTFHAQEAGDPRQVGERHVEDLQ